MAKVEIYTQAGCPFCVQAVALLKQKGVPFQEIDAPRGTPEREEAIKRSGGGQTVPQIFVDDQSLGGCRELMQLDHGGALEFLLQRS
ncbi:glutaredoxin 3 [Saccharibacter floricola]|uniref:Glutaredoxin n=1 Tax=Saccharibacter floricola DSM 15669 TaxID=1123227 RepID=A0ABQ0NW85_9PROT|nr:glutaredoxin 3 [Saccharibacter floricola]GBQ04701.1 glutaredoxin [Saccharibacter floricola DSM 15669]